MASKVTASLSDSVYDRLADWVKHFHTTPSLVVEAALQRFGELHDVQRARTVRELMATKKSKSKTGWIGLFWDVLAEECGTANFDTTGAYITVTRQYDYFDTTCLSFYPADDDGTIVFSVRESSPIVAGIETLFNEFQFRLADSPHASAEEVAAWIHAHQDRAAELRAKRTEAIGESLER